jgi:hypothetical protein
LDDTFITIADAKTYDEATIQRLKVNYPISPSRRKYLEALKALKKQYPHLDIIIC